MFSHIFVNFDLKLFVITLIKVNILIFVCVHHFNFNASECIFSVNRQFCYMYITQLLQLVNYSCVFIDFLMFYHKLFYSEICHLVNRNFHYFPVVFHLRFSRNCRCNARVGCDVLVCLQQIKAEYSCFACFLHSHS